MPGRPERLGLVLGGTRLRARLPLLERTIPRAHVVCIAGPVATTFAHWRSGVITLGHTRDERAALQRVTGLLDAAGRRGALIVTPADVVAFRDFQSGRALASVPVDDLRPGWTAADAGHLTLAAFRGALLGTDTVIWTGALGLAGEHPFARGSIALARMLSRTGPASPRLVLSGRDTVAVVRAAGVEVVASSTTSVGQRPHSRKPDGAARSETP
ncbi:MAG: phosphoglycerate kinase [Dehalococcoidia bacterium]|nr:phosphoglycerate kinase [Dehalococcoidia bacterium]